MRSCERALLFPAAKTDYRFIILVTKTNVVCIKRTVTLSLLANLLPLLKVSLYVSLGLFSGLVTPR